MKKQTNEEEGRRPSATFRVGAIALVFLIIGYQLALFVYKASVTAVVAHRDRPDTVYVVDPALARRLLSDAGMAGQAGHDETDVIPGSDRGSEMPVKGVIRMLEPRLRRLVEVDAETLKRGEPLHSIDDKPAVLDMYLKAWERIKEGE